MFRVLMLALLLAAPLAWSEEGAGEARFYVVRHVPGPQWDASRAFTEQPGIERHVGYMRDLLDRGVLVMGGPFPDNSGGMIVILADSDEDARAIAGDDPAVRAGLLGVEVKPWRVVMSSVRFTRPRRAESSIPRDQPFTVEPAAPEAPINIERR